MHILLSTQDLPPDVGGTQTYADALAARLGDLAGPSGRVTVLAPSVPDSGEADRAASYSVVRIRFAGYNTFGLRAARAARGLLDSGIDAVVCVQWSAAISLVGPCARRGIPVLIAAHGRELLFNPFRIRFLRRVYDRLRRRTLLLASACLPVSRYTGGLLADIGVPAGRIVVVTNGTEPTRFMPRPGDAFRATLGLADEPIVLTVARLVRKKGVDIVIEAFKSVRQKFPRAVLLIAGDGPERAALEAAASEGVRFLGSVAHERLPEIYSAATVFVLASRASLPDVEGLPIVFLEASACGTPVVGALSGGTDDAILDGETGTIVPADDVATVADALNQLLGDPGLAKRFGAAGRRHVERHANWDRAARDVFAVIQREVD